MTVLVQDAPALRRSWLDTAFAFSSRQPLGTFGLVVVVVAAIAGLSAEWIAPYSPTSNDFAAMTEPPSAAHWLGTDQFGRDLLSRIIYGTHPLIIGFVSAFVGGFFGLIIDVGSACFGGVIGLVRSA
jgi:peptide/nickel transport system permease protein